MVICRFSPNPWCFNLRTLLLPLDLCRKHATQFWYAIFRNHGLFVLSNASSKYLKHVFCRIVAANITRSVWIIWAVSAFCIIHKYIKKYKINYVHLKKSLERLLFHFFFKRKQADNVFISFLHKKTKSQNEMRYMYNRRNVKERKNYN